MSEENQVANSSENSTASETKVETPQTQEQPQAEAQSAPEPKEDNSQPFHQHPRFKELINEKNELKEKLSQMESLLQERSQPQGPTPLELSKKELVDLGIREDAAEKMLKAFDRVAESRVQNVTAPIAQKTIQAEVDSWINDFSKEHADFKDLEPQMNEVFASLPQQTKFTIASDPKGLELLYAHVKQMNSKAELDKAYQKGVQDGYKGKASKSSVTPGLSGAANPPGDLTPEAIAKMSIEEYKKRRDEIWATQIPKR